MVFFWAHRPYSIPPLMSSGSRHIWVAVNTAVANTGCRRRLCRILALGCLEDHILISWGPCVQFDYSACAIPVPTITVQSSFFLSVPLGLVIFCVFHKVIPTEGTRLQLLRIDDCVWRYVCGGRRTLWHWSSWFQEWNPCHCACVTVYLLTGSFGCSRLGFHCAFFLTVDVEYFECTC